MADLIRDRRKYSLFVAILVAATILGSLTLNAYYTQRVAHDSEQRIHAVYQDALKRQQRSHAALCNLFSIFTETDEKPVTARAKEIQKRLQEVKQVECGEP